ncbi:MAG TPA: RloB family protein [Bacteroidales bacterium]|nr:RloB family protein [Bacteroidales bacterium]HPL05328.1 RloB family protein [Bacteroidales bacterium]
MKDKKAEQKAAKQKHLEQLKTQRRKEPILERPVAELTEKPSILIVCEGKNTEPSYFNQFRIPSVDPVGEGYNTVSLVNRAIELSQQKNYDQVWCVFDKDDFNDNDFNTAIKIAVANNFGVAYSNQSFEYWLILHFNDHQGGGMHRNSYNDKINEHLKPFKVTYDGNGTKLIEEDFFELLDGIDDKTSKKRAELAIDRAERNYNNFDHTNPAREESSTTVFRLVRELLKYVE